MLKNHLLFMFQTFLYILLKQKYIRIDTEFFLKLRNFILFYQFIAELFL